MTSGTVRSGSSFRSRRNDAGSHPGPRRRWRAGGRRGVSDVIATILLLALTVTLFAAIFAFVTTFPGPPAQNSNQFSASLISGSVSGKNYILGLNITHLAGPQVSLGAQVYLKSAETPSACPFTGFVTAGSGLPTGATVWNLGQTWSRTFSSASWCGSTYVGDPVPDNITVDIVQNGNLIYSVILPGQGFTVPPTITSTWTSPGSPTSGQAYTVYASISGALVGNKAYLTGVPGEASGVLPMFYNSTTGYWQYSILAGNTSAVTTGTYTGFVNVTGAYGTTATAAVTVSIVAGSSGQALTVGLFLSSPPAASATETLQALVTYNGGLQSAGLTVGFWANTSTGTNLWSGTGPSGLKISGPTSESVYSQTTWVVPSGPQSYVLRASATVAGFGSAAGSLSFTTVSPAITVSPTQGPTGASIQVSGTGFTLSSTATLVFGTSSITTCTSGSLTTSATGTFGCTFAVPTGYASTSPTITATDVSSGLTATTSFTVTTPGITVSPTSGAMGISVTVSGTGFSVSSAVTLKFGTTAEATCTTGSLTTSATGTFSCAFAVPSKNWGTSQTITATDPGGQTATTTFSVTTMSISTSACSGSCTPGSSTVTVTGTGFTAGGTVKIYFKDGATNTSVTTCTTGSLTASATGTVSCVFTVPSGDGAGTATLSVEDVSSATWVTKSITVA